MRKSTVAHSSIDHASRVCVGIGSGGGDGDPLTVPIAQSTTFTRTGVGTNPDNQYSRVSNPTVAALESALGRLEDTPPAVCFSTGLAAETALFLSLLKTGDHVVCGRSVYGGTTRLLQQLLPELGITCTFVDSTDPVQIADSMGPATKLVFIETPSNPTLELTDIAAVASVAHAAGALLAVDNTFLTSALQRPLDLGADISVYSTTKFIDGHSIALGGAVVCKDEEYLNHLRFIRKCTGAIQTPFNAWLTINGLKTLPIRIAQQSAAAEAIGRWLSKQSGVASAYYPGLDVEASAALARRQHPEGNGAVVTFEVPGGVEAGKRFVESLELCTLVEHVGSVETLITHPASMTHADVPENEREEVGITGGLLRLSVGLEPLEAIIEDLNKGFEAISSTCTAAESEVDTCGRSH